EDGIRDFHVTGVQTCALPILRTEIYQCTALKAETALGIMPDDIVQRRPPNQRPDDSRPADCECERPVDVTPKRHSRTVPEADRSINIEPFRQKANELPRGCQETFVLR